MKIKMAFYKLKLFFFQCASY